LGVAALEDKILQRAVVEVLNAVYEADFLGFSYGFRPGRSQHQALDALAVGICRRKVNWILDADIRGFYDAIDHGWMLKFLEHRIADRRLLGLIRKWLKAGVIEDGKWSATEEGAAQGASVSPLLSNVYLHFVFDLWADQWRRNARGNVIVVRFADDYVVGFQYRSDAERFLADLRGRLAKFGLELAAEKTRLIEFGRYAARNRTARGLGKPETFQFLGLTHICAKSRRHGWFQLKRVTDTQRMHAKLHKVKAEMRRRMHRPIPEQGAWLGAVVQGHMNYYAVPGNLAAVTAYRKQVKRYWLHALRRRSQRDHLTWEEMSRLEARWLPKPRVVHPWPDARFDARPKPGAQ
jgi:group II intron reverse transcriptase/maturase